MNFIRSTAAYSLVCYLLQALPLPTYVNQRPRLIHGGSVPRYGGQTAALLIGPDPSARGYY
jgi:hypothetical protein